MPDEDDIPEQVDLPIDGVLDLHAFRPQDVPSVVSDYLDECRARGILEVRIIHGKGIGALRETVHAVLARRMDVVRSRLDPDSTSSWGATLVTLTGPDPRGERPTPRR